MDGKVQEVLDEVERELDADDLELPEDDPDAVVLAEGFGSETEHSETPVEESATGDHVPGGEPLVVAEQPVEAKPEEDERKNLTGEHIDNILLNIHIPEKPPLVEQGELTKEEYQSVWGTENGYLIHQLVADEIRVHGPTEGKKSAAHKILERIHRMKYLMAVVKIKWKANHAELERLLQELDAETSKAIRARDKEMSRKRQTLTVGDASGVDKPVTRRKPPVDKRQKAIQSLVDAGMSREQAEAMLGSDGKS